MNVFEAGMYCTLTYLTSYWAHQLSKLSMMNMDIDIGV